MVKAQTVSTWSSLPAGTAQACRPGHRALMSRSSLSQCLLTAQTVRGAASLPHSTGRRQRICVFASGQDAEDARRAGADVVGDEELIDTIQVMSHCRQWQVLWASETCTKLIAERLGQAW